MSCPLPTNCPGFCVALCFQALDWVNKHFPRPQRFLAKCCGWWWRGGVGGDGGEGPIVRAEMQLTWSVEAGTLQASKAQAASLPPPPAPIIWVPQERQASDVFKGQEAQRELETVHGPLGAAILCPSHRGQPSSFPHLLSLCPLWPRRLPGLLLMPGFPLLCPGLGRSHLGPLHPWNCSFVVSN